MASPVGLHGGIYQTESEHLVPQKIENSCFLGTCHDLAVGISQCLKHYSAQNIADYLESSIGSIPHCYAASLENIPHITSVKNIPHCLTTSLENILHCIMTSLENLPLCLATDVLWTFSCCALYCVRKVVAHGDAREGKWRGNWRMEWVASTLTWPRNVLYPALLTLMRTPRLPAVDWTDSPADLNGLIRLGERRNVVSARVPSRSARAVPNSAKQGHLEIILGRTQNLVLTVSWTLNLKWFWLLTYLSKAICYFCSISYWRHFNPRGII